MTELVDISSNNGPINFPEVRKAGISGVFVKATEGISYEDPPWKNYVLGARRAGLRVGLYHFARPDLGHSPQSEADHFYTVGKQLMPYDLPWVLDIEKGTNIGAWSEAFLVRLHSLCGSLPALYTSPGWWEGEQAGATDHIASYPLWVAHYGVNKPMIPHPWTDYRWWQYTDSGSVSGISGHVDLNHGKDEGFLMALTDAEQKDLYDKVKHIFNALSVLRPQGDAIKAEVDAIQKKLGA